MTYQSIDINLISESDKTHIHSCFLNNWKNVQIIGKGTNSVVYLYKNYAIKVFTKNACDTKDFSILSELQEYNCFPKLYYGVKNENFIYNEWLYIVTEYLEGITLSNHHESYTNDNIINAITFAFYSSLKKDYMMNDIISENIMIQPNGEIKFFDVGAFIRLTPDMYDYQKKVNNHYSIITEEFKKWDLSYTA